MLWLKTYFVAYTMLYITFLKRKNYLRGILPTTKVFLSAKVLFPPTLTKKLSVGNEF